VSGLLGGEYLTQEIKPMTIEMKAERTYRSADERIQDLQTKIAGIKSREERKKLRADPVVREVTVAVKALGKALTAAQDDAARKTIEEARQSLAALVPARSPQAAPSDAAAPQVKREKRSKGAAA